MHEVLNTLYIQTQGTYLALDHETVRVVIEDVTRLRVPLIRLDGIVVFGQVNISPFLIHRCADDGRALVWLSNTGRFKARIEGHVRGNVLLRRAQHLCVSDAARCLDVAQTIVAGKLQNSRQRILRAARDVKKPEHRLALRAVAAQLAANLLRIKHTRTLDELRGVEGESGRGYFSVFNHMISPQASAFSFDGRSRRPPRDRINALISFLYGLVRGECAAALEGIGLDPQVGFLHVLRPGRPSLALDMMEELRPVVADQFALTLINRQQLRADHFDEQPSGAVLLNEEGRKLVLHQYQERKHETVHHRLLDRAIPLGLVPHVQARILARYLRRDIQHYIPFLYR